METVKDLGKVDSITLADYILYKHGPMSHLKLQKLLYLIEGYHLAYFGQSLIDDEFEAWVHGPVSRKVYNSLKDKSKIYSDLGYELKEGNELPDTMIARDLSSEQLSLVEDVLELYKDESGMSLEYLTHQQDPWINARRGIEPQSRCTTTISKQDMVDYFRKFVDA